MKYPVWCCQHCGETIGILGRFVFPWFHKCEQGESPPPTTREILVISSDDAEAVLRSFDELNPYAWPVVLQRLREKSQRTGRQ